MLKTDTNVNINNCNNNKNKNINKNNKEYLENTNCEPDFTFPSDKKKLLLHSCCAPCSGPVIEKIAKNNIDLTIYFYNPNIHPKKEYEIRKNENKRFAEKLNLPFIDADYDVVNWFDLVKGLENEPERGIRCTACFDMRFVKTAQYAALNGFDVFTSSLGISRWKDMDQINASGLFAANQYNITYWDYNWRKNNGSARMYTLAKEEHFYKQEYCGCIYSLRDTNKWREQNNRPKIEIGNEYYS